jgi:hypothetical protein
MKEFEQMLYDALAQAVGRGELKEEEVGATLDKTMAKLVPESASALIKGLKRAAPKMLREQKASDAGFMARNYRRWKKPLDLLEMLWVISEEIGGKFNQEQRPRAITEKDYQFEALVSLHARALLVSREVLCLLYGGFPDGALSRWRSLHELSVIAAFLQSHDQEISHRYLASFPFASYHAANQLNQHAERAKMDAFSDQEMKAMKERCEAFARRFGEEMYEEYGWASPALKNPKPNFAQLEKAVALDHWRPRYRWASQHTHGGYRPPLAILGTAETAEPLHLVGQSNSGFTDPIHMTAISLNQITTTLLVTQPTVDTIIFMKVLSDLAEEIGDVALEEEKRTLEQARKAELGRKGRQGARRTRSKNEQR